MTYDFITLFQNYGIDYDLKQNPGWVNVECPYCLDGKKHGGFNLAGGYFHCWKHGGRRLESVIGKVLRLDHHKTSEVLSSFGGAPSFTERLNKREAKAKSLILPGGPLTKPYRDYIRDRGFSPAEIVRKYGVQAGGPIGDWRFRLMIPFYLKGKLVTYQGRDISGKQKLRYKTLGIEESVIDPKDMFYGLDYVKGDRVGVVEGVVDSWRMGPGFIASLGTSLTPAQISYLRKHFKTVFFLFDPEAEAQGKAMKNAELIASLGIDAHIVDIESDSDPGDLPPEEALSIRRELNFMY